MSTDIDPSADLKLAKPIILAGQQWKVLPLPLRQVLALADLLPKLKDINIDNLKGDMFLPVVDMVRRGLLKAYPGITEADLLDMPISIAELIDAIPVVTGQAGAKKAESPAGEAPATNPSNPPTGAGSSPT